FDPRPRDLRQGPIQGLHWAVLVQAVSFDISNHADNLTHHAREKRQRQALADRILVRPEAPGNGLTNDDYRWAAGNVRLVEVAATYEGHSNRRQISGTDNANIHLRLLRHRHGRLTFDCYRLV